MSWGEGCQGQMSWGEGCQGQMAESDAKMSGVIIASLIHNLSVTPDETRAGGSFNLKRVTTLLKIMQWWRMNFYSASALGVVQLSGAWPVNIHHRKSVSWSKQSTGYPPFFVECMRVLKKQKRLQKEKLWDCSPDERLYLLLHALGSALHCLTESVNRR